MLLAGAVPVSVSVLFGVAESPENLAAAVLSVLLLAAATVVGIQVLGRGLDHALHGGPVPMRERWVYLVLAIAAGVVSFVGFGASVKVRARLVPAPSPGARSTAWSVHSPQKTPPSTTTPSAVVSPSSRGRRGAVRDVEPAAG